MSSHLNIDEGQPLLSGTSTTENDNNSDDGHNYDNSAYSHDGMGLDEVDINPYESAPPERKQRISGRTLMVVGTILVTELCERLTFYSVVGSMVLYCTSHLKFPSIDAANISLIFQGLFLLPASAVDFKAWFGEDSSGRAYALDLTGKRGFFLTGLVFIAIGTGGIKANVGPFGAQQVEKLGDVAVQTFFNWFYWFINVGGLIAFSAVSYIQQEVSFSWGYLVPLISMIVAILIFLFSRRCYAHLEVQGSVLTTVFKICHTGCEKSEKKVKFFDKARTSHGGKFDDYTVDGLICALRVLPIFLLVIIYWAVYSQMTSTFFLQGERLNVAIGDGKLPVAILNVFNTIAILILIPLVDRLVYPFFTRIGRPLTHLKRMGIGFLLAAMSVIAAGVLEIYRKDELRSSGGIVQQLGGETFNSSHITLFAQVPQFALIGASEVFASISALEFAFTQVPHSMQGLVTGLCLAASGLGNYVSMAITNIVVASTRSDPWFPDEINNGKAENLFFLIGGLMLLNFIIFVFVARAYKYRDVAGNLPPDKTVTENTDNPNTKL
ncbi:solute carrier family 15 member 4-like isoform X2 [Gigantopelta aegis]|uniref:solute carrier family 15 member 4-like isoform X2 n=1 Tax=Gigantopelta aegis TaxID=1735272 RepID=UPI001B88C694|nr:solute carrier family 15 member 4-like isoform X2 [Gigantopelta aegis]